MKAIVKKDIWKAIAFLVIVIVAFSCTSCDPDLEVKPIVKIAKAENIKNYSATLYGSVIPNGKVKMYFAYRDKTNGSPWVREEIKAPFDGEEEIAITLGIKELLPGTNYEFVLIAVVGSKEFSSESSNFSTLVAKKGFVSEVSISNLDFTSTTINASFIANHDDTEASFKWRRKGSTAWSVYNNLGTKFSGQDTVKVSHDLKDLSIDTEYEFCFELTNRVGKTISDTIIFETYAVRDRDGNKYHAVTIGTQTWLKENFKGTHFANGDPIPNVTDQEEWNKATTPAYCYYNNDEKLGEIYGGLYNLEVVSDSRGLIEGWRSPKDKDAEVLDYFLDNSRLSGAALKEVGFSHWLEPNLGANNKTGFTALPGGFRATRFYKINESAVFITNEKFMGSALFFSLDYRNGGLSTSWGSDVKIGASLRLIKN